MTFEPFWFALRFLTRIPVPAGISNDPVVAGRSLLAYPCVGGVIGLWLLGIVHAMPNGAPPAILAAIVLLFWILLTGALHLDGLADCADAWLGGYGDPERTRQILKDPHVGSAAIVALVAVLLIKFAGLQTLLERPEKLEILFWTPLIGRSVALGALTFVPYAQSQGLASTWLAHLPSASAKALLALLALLIAWRVGVGALLAVVAIFWGVSRLSMARLGGVTGDVCGALVELAETTVLLVAALA